MSARRQTRGFTLIELMVSIALFGLIASGAMSLVISGVRMQTHSSRVDVAQSAARAGLDFMTRDLLSATTGMGSTSIMIGLVATPTITVAAANNNTASANYATGSDILDFYMADSNFDFSTVFLPVTTASTVLTVDKTAQFSAGQYLMLTDLTNALRIKIISLTAPTGSPSTGTITIAAPGVGGFPTGVATYVGMTSYVFALKHVTYSVQQCFSPTTYNAAYAVTTYANQNCLMMDLWDGPVGTNNGSNPQPLAEGVEDMQVAYAFDNNLDGNITDASSTTDEWTYNATGDATPVTLANLKAIRISIVAISTMNENVGSPQQRRPAVEDHPQAAALDGFFRRVIRSEVTVRNLNI